MEIQPLVIHTSSSCIQSKGRLVALLTLFLWACGECVGGGGLDVWGEGRWMRVRRPEQNYGGIYDKIFGEEPHTPATPALYLFIPYCISCLLEFIRD